jgi:hypothetical protein
LYRGEQGGLYPGGQNIRPAAHEAAGIQMAGRIRPLDVAGRPDDLNGRVVMLSVGMSNAMQEFDVFLSLVDTFPSKHPALTVVNGAQAGKDIDQIINPLDRYWINLDDTLNDLGLSPLQVQVIWFKQAEAYPMDGNDTTFSVYVDGLKAKFIAAMNIIRDRFPNARLCYIAGRIYGGYATDLLNPEPFAYYTSWSVKHMIGDQINGDPSLAYSGPDAAAPWLSWGVYLWADGIVPRSDGLTWLCPDDYLPDGNHPSDAGRLKVANMLLDFLSTDVTTTPWFLDPGALVVPTAPSNLTAGAIGSTQINLAWTDNSDNELGFSVERRTRQSAFAVIGTVASGVTAFSNTGLQPNTTYEYRVQAYNPAGASAYSNTARAKTRRAGLDVNAASSVIENGHSISCYPNPFNPSTTFSYALSEPAQVSLKIYNSLGQLVKTVVEEFQAEGYYSATWDGKNETGATVSSGIYLYRMTAGKLNETRRMLLIK